MGGRENAFLKAKDEDGEGWIKSFTLLILVFFVCIWFFGFLY